MLIWELLTCFSLIRDGQPRGICLSTRGRPGGTRGPVPVTLMRRREKYFSEGSTNRYPEQSALNELPLLLLFYLLKKKTSLEKIELKGICQKAITCRLVYQVPL